MRPGHRSNPPCSSPILRVLFKNQTKLGGTEAPKSGSGTLGGERPAVALDAFRKKGGGFSNSLSPDPSPSSQVLLLLPEELLLPEAVLKKPLSILNTPEAAGLEGFFPGKTGAGPVFSGVAPGFCLTC